MQSVAFLPLTKADSATQTIWARAALEQPDKAREIMDYVSARPQFESWSQRFQEATLGKSLGNIRAMHNPQHLAGKVTEIVFDDAEKTVDVCLKVLDPVDWAKVQEGGYTGLSIGGGYVRKWADETHAGHIRYTPRIAEISLVDNPCMDGARFLTLQKADGATEQVMLKGHPRSFAEMTPPRTFGDLAKAGFAFRAPLRAFGRKVVEGVAEEGAEVAGKIKPLPKKPGSKIVGVGIDRTFKGVTIGDLAKVSLRGVGAGVQRAWNAGVVPAVTAGKTVRDAASLAGGGLVIAEELHRRRENRMPAHMKKSASAAQREKIAETMREHKEGTLRSWRGLNAHGKPRRGPKVTDRRQAIAIALSQARRLGKGEGDLGKGALDEMEEAPLSLLRAPRYMRKSTSLGDAFNLVTSDPTRFATAAREAPPEGLLRRPSYMAKAMPRDLRSAAERHRGGPGTGAQLGLTGAAFATLHNPRALAGAMALGAAAGGAAGRVANVLQDRSARQHGRAANKTLSGKEHAQRVAAAKARWMKEGQHDFDPGFDAQKQIAGKALLGRQAKMDAIEGHRKNAWLAVHEAQQSYDRARKHLPKGKHLMMEVPHMGGLLYNPESVGAGHFGPKGHPKAEIHQVHPAEVDDWIEMHGQGGLKVRERSDLPTGTRRGITAKDRELREKHRVGNRGKPELAKGVQHIDETFIGAEPDLFQEMQAA